MLIGTLVGWALLIAIVTIAWARLHASVRAAEGIDEALYAEGLDEASLNEAY